MKAPVLLVALLIAAFASPGCLLNCGRITTAEWEQSGVFERFPPEGYRGGYHVFYVNTPQGELAHKYAQTENSTKMSLRAEPDGDVSWKWNSDRDHSQDDTQEALDTMFATLGLPKPANGDEPFDWSGNEC